MNKKISILTTALVSLALVLGGINEAQAKRMGGGSSFGSKPSYSAPYQRSASPSPSASPSAAPSSQPTHSPAAAQNQTARQGWANRGGFMGMLGGLALGGLLGSLFFGGAFEGINFMDMLLFAGIAFVLYRLFAAKASQSQAQPIGTAYGRTSHSVDTAPQANTGAANPAGFETDVMFGKDKAAPAPVVSLPAGFDKASFMSGAESAFRYLQAAWDKGDLASIRGLTTDKVFAEIQDQLRASNGSNKTEVLKLQSELLEAREVGNDLEATVLFDSLMREDDGNVEQVREVWHFIKPKNSSQPKWYLDGIQQLAD
jgi:predicted lipid-binding transport protein (Tim44 family)